VTDAGELATQLLIHAVVMSRNEPVSRQTVRHALTSALQRAEAWQIKDIAIPPFGLGAGNLEIAESADVMVDVIAMHTRRAQLPETITLVAETEDEERALASAVERSGL
jgi:O-acetyl-ADP-ribose deacetylase (regulator of RNase III)